MMTEIKKVLRAFAMVFLYIGLAALLVPLTIKAILWWLTFILGSPGLYH